MRSLPDMETGIAPGGVALLPIGIPVLFAWGKTQNRFALQADMG